jgi:hypothetical protein
MPSARPSRRSQFIKHKACQRGTGIAMARKLSRAAVDAGAEMPVFFAVWRFYAQIALPINRQFAKILTPFRAQI